MVILISKHRTESQLLEEKWKKMEKEMKTIKRMNVDLNLNSDPLGRKKKRCLCFRLDAFLLQWRHLLFGSFLCVRTGRSLELTRSVALMRHYVAICLLRFGLRYCIWDTLPFFFFNWAIVISLKCSGTLSQVAFYSLQIEMFCLPMLSCGPPLCLFLSWDSSAPIDSEQLTEALGFMNLNHQWSSWAPVSEKFD